MWKLLWWLFGDNLVMKDANWVRQVFSSLDAMDTEDFLSFLADGAFLEHLADEE